MAFRQRVDGPCMSPVRSVSGDDGRYFGSSRPPRLAICVCVLICVGLAVALGASAAPPAARSRTYDLQFAPAALGEGQPAITISGGRVTRFFVAVPVACAPPAEYEFVMSLPTPAAVADGHFSFSGDLRSADPRAGGQFSISGTITPGGDLVSGTATLSNMHSGPFSGCSESYRFLGLPAAAAVTAPPTPVPQDRNFASRYISFDYTHHAVTRLLVEANIMCGQAIHSAFAEPSLYGITSIPTSTTGKWSYRANVFDGYQAVMSFKMNGQISGHRAFGRITVTEPTGFTSLGARCAGSYAWTAEPPPP